MATAYCIDISGSIRREEIQAALNFVEKGLERGDHVILFDVHAVVVLAPFGNIQLPNGGGTDATEALKLAKELGVHQTVYIGDGYMMPEQFDAFSKTIDIVELEKSNGKRVVNCKRL